MPVVCFASCFIFAAAPPQGHQHVVTLYRLLAHSHFLSNIALFLYEMTMLTLSFLVFTHLARRRAWWLWKFMLTYAFYVFIWIPTASNFGHYRRGVKIHKTWYRGWKPPRLMLNLLSVYKFLQTQAEQGITREKNRNTKINWQHSLEQKLW